MTTTMQTDEVIFWFLVIPAIVVWVGVVVDIARRRGLTLTSRVAWVASVTLLLPTALVWLLVRPAGDPMAEASTRGDPDDPQEALVALVVAHDVGDVDDATFARRRDALFRLAP